MVGGGQRIGHHPFRRQYWCRRECGAWCPFSIGNHLICRAMEEGIFSTEFLRNTIHYSNIFSRGSLSGMDK